MSHVWQVGMRYAGAIFALAAGGFLLNLPADRIKEHEFKVGLQRPLPPSLNRKDALTEQLTLFSLGGLRSLAAEILTLDATSAWIDRDWERLQRRWESITTLNPHRLNYWISASRDMAINAAADVSNDKRLEIHQRATRTRHYIDRGEKFLQDAILHNPDSALLYAHLGDLYSDLYRRPRFTLAVEAYKKAAQLGAPAIYQRQYFYNLCRIRGREKEAWEVGKALYSNPRNRMPSVRSLMFVLQQKAKIPAEEALSIEELFGNEEKARRDLKNFERNSLLFPTYGIKEFLQENHP
ncbi:MAG: hypothetical protein IJB31_00060 [Akkermansia sp.]|nr:hypothetical protein [Akkermansia sp.]